MLPARGLAGTGWGAVLRTTLLFLSPSDLYTAPDSCEGRCGEPYSEEDECHCHAECERHRSCCGDYHRHCRAGEHPPVRGGAWEGCGVQKGWWQARLCPWWCVFACVVLGSPCFVSSSP